jgi:uncharacterized membrane protein YfcA
MEFGLGLAIGAVGTVLGVLVGATGIGGVLLVPILTLVVHIDVKHAIAAALLSYLPTCVVAVILYARRGSIPWREAWFLCAAAVPAAWLGARAASMAPAALLETAVGALLLAGGLYALRTPRITPAGKTALSPATLIGLGAATGFVSAMTGGGGAFVLLPVLLLLDTPLLAAIGMCQAIAIPISALASVANLAAGLVDLSLATLLAASLTLGIAIGTPIAHALPQQKLRRLLGSAVVLAGTAMLLHTAGHLLRG